MINIEIDEEVFNPVYLPLIENYSRYNFIKGGGGSGKSVAIAQRTIKRYLSEPGRNMIALRKVDRASRMSVFAELQNVIIEWKLEDLFKVNNTEKLITCKPNKNQILCGGLDNPEKIKSVKFARGIVTDIWLEEATEFTKDDYFQARNRLRGRCERSKQLTISFNPISHLHWIKGAFYDSPSDHIVNNGFYLSTTYKDNKFLEDIDREAYEDLKNIDKMYYDVYALGEWGVLGDVIFNNWDVVENLPEHYDASFYGLDWGYSSSFGTLVKIYEVGENDVFLHEIIYEKGLQNNELVSKARDLGVGEYDTIYADSEDPKSIDDARSYGFKGILKAYKPGGSVMSGIEYMLTKRFHILRSSQNIINEFGLYQRKKDINGNALPAPVKYKDHTIDAVRMALYSRFKGITGISEQLEAAIFMNK